MTLDDLEKIYGKSWASSGSHRAGIRAVVEALRDELLRKEGPDTHNLSERIGLRVAVKMFNNILGGAGNEKAAGGPTREDGPDVVISSVSTSAADPSTAVCEWRMVGKTFANAGCEDEYLWSHEYKVCPSCGKPISFREK